MMRASHSGTVFALLCLAATAVPGAGRAETPCINARLEGFMGPPILTFSRANGASVDRTNAELVAYDAAAATLSVSDIGERRALPLNEWTSIEFRIRRPPPQAQMVRPNETVVTELSDQKFSLSTMKVARGIVSYGDCSVSAAEGEVRFEGKLSFDTANDRLVVDGRFVQFVFPSGGPVNPGVGK
jgi:hypothetical protein